MELVDSQNLQHHGLERIAIIIHNIILQYARRILFHDPVLSLKALDNDDFSVEDLTKFDTVWVKQTAIGLLWWRDSTLEALTMFSSGGKPNNAANVGDPSEFDY
jgi:hypothetical protein